MNSLLSHNPVRSNTKSHLRVSLTFFVLFSWIAIQGQETQDTIQLKSATIESFFNPAESHNSQLIEPMKAIEAGALSIGEALQNQTSIAINSYGSSGVQAISLRGTGANQTQVYWNGFNVNSPTLGQADLSIFPSAGLSRVQIHSGLTSLIDGSGGLGGSIQMESDLDFNKGLNALISSQLASFHNYSGLLNVQWSDDKFSSLTSLSYQNAINDFRYVNPIVEDEKVFTNVNGEFQKTNVLQGLGFQLDENNSIKAFLWWNDNNRFIPPIISNENGLSDTLIDSALRTSLSWQHLREKSSHEILFAYFDEQQEFHSNSLYLYHFKNSHVAYRNVTYFPNDIRLKGSLSCHNNQIQSGGFSGNVVQEKYDAMVNLRIPIGEKLEMDMIARYEMIDGASAPLMPMLALMYKPFGRMSFNASIARSYRNPTLNDLYWSPGGNPELKSEEGWSREIGVKWNSLRPSSRNRFTSKLEFTYFSGSIDNWILWSPQDNFWTPENLYHVENSGVEMFLEAKYKLKKKANITFNIRYSYTDSKNTKSDVLNDRSLGKQIIYVPFHVANANLKLEYKKLGLEYRYYFSSKRFMHRDHSAWMPYYMLSSISGSAKLGNHFSFNVTINNLLNKNYQVMPHQAMYGRNYALRITYQFKQSKS